MPDAAVPPWPTISGRLCSCARAIPHHDKGRFSWYQDGPHSLPATQDTCRDLKCRKAYSTICFPPIVLSLGHIPKTEHQKQPLEEKQGRFSHLQVTCILKERKTIWQGRCGATHLAQSSRPVFRSQLFKMLMSFKCHLLPLVSPPEPPWRKRSQRLGQPWVPVRSGAALYLPGQIEGMARGKGGTG